ncbi:MAG: hypothetical protein AAFV71_26660, partial [Cyanobacteria bacterium J06633_8]
ALTDNKMSHRRCRLSGDTPVYLGFNRNICKTVGHFISWISLMPMPNYQFPTFNWSLVTDNC